tara:strand:+ start:1190 stop:1372 length:183 start_codon:yes stop_codon:yes gene_type:complete
MKKYTETIALKVTPTQFKTLDKLRKINIRVSNFIREAIAEKINREAEELKEKPKEVYCPW